MRVVRNFRVIVVKTEGKVRVAAMCMKNVVSALDVTGACFPESLGLVTFPVRRLIQGDRSIVAARAVVSRGLVWDQVLGDGCQFAAVVEPGEVPKVGNVIFSSPGVSLARVGRVVVIFT